MARREQGRHTALGLSILRGIDQARSYARGDEVTVHSTTFHIPHIDVRQVRSRVGLSQTEFAQKFGFSVATLRNWEQGRREPEVPARILLAIIDKHPAAVEDVLAFAK